MLEGLHALALLAVLCWATLIGLTAVFLRMAMRADAGFGAVGRGRERRRLSRPGMPPVAMPPRHVNSPGGRW